VKLIKDNTMDMYVRK